MDLLCDFKIVFCLIVVFCIAEISILDLYCISTASTITKVCRLPTYIAVTIPLEI